MKYLRPMGKNRKGLIDSFAGQALVGGVLLLMILGIVLAVSTRVNSQMRVSAVGSGATNAELSIYDNTTNAFQTFAQQSPTVSIVIIAVGILALVLGVVALARGRS